MPRERRAAWYSRLLQLDPAPVERAPAARGKSAERLALAGICMAGAAVVLFATARRHGVTSPQPPPRLRSSPLPFAGLFSLSDHSAMLSLENRCPYDAVALSQADCRQVPDLVGKQLHRPFVITSADDPRGCFAFMDWVYYNIHPIGSARRGRRVFCKHSKVPTRYQRIAKGICNDYGFLPISDESGCRGAAVELGLVDVNVYTASSAERPEGCYYFANLSDATGTLWLNTSPDSKGRGAQASEKDKSWARQPICKAQTTPAPPRTTRGVDPETAAAAQNLSSSYVARNSGSNGCEGAHSLNELECQMMPRYFGGGLHDPFVIHSSGSPRGCFAFNHWFFFNRHPFGAQEEGRKPYCKLARIFPTKLHSVRVARGCGDECMPSSNLTKIKMAKV
mmetsp:Transcript_26281/g.61294  ORF Transcript_26281/g.61294 Transcript_26281/m.61294 type:complete len:394 (-) Transcript_26281:105-1286(-)